jgi:hypothetical protein
MIRSLPITINPYDKPILAELVLWYIRESLKALVPEDRERLCGRADVVREIVDNCRAERLTVLTSEPGLGVTSVFSAGVMPALRRRGFIVALFNDWQGRFFATRLRENIAEAVRLQADPNFHARQEDLDELLDRARRQTGVKVAVLLDQFEDYVRCHSNTVISDKFDAELAHAVATRRGVFVIGLQDYAIPAFERLMQHIPNLLGFHIVLPPLSAEAAREVVVSEARAANLEVEPAALDELTTASMVLLEENKVHPFFLKVATGILIDEETRLKSPVLRAATIEAQGGVDRVVLDSMNAKIAGLSSAHADLLFRWGRKLISPENHRLSVTEKGLTSQAGKLHRHVPTLLQLLTSADIIRSVEFPEALRYELSRECLAPILRDWWERREAVIVARRRAAFRIKSLSVAVAAIAVMYVLWVIFGTR